VLINNAGIARFGVIEETEPAVWRQVLEINLTGSYLGIRAVASSMRTAGGGAIVNISSGAGFTATFGLTAARPAGHRAQRPGNDASYVNLGRCAYLRRGLSARAQASSWSNITVAASSCRAAGRNVEKFSKSVNIENDSCWRT
jgi:NAD(P)-dependent dehydrogenase (short-subunit alcohol dehydrogenase family)